MNRRLLEGVMLAALLAAGSLVWPGSVRSAGPKTVKADVSKPFKHTSHLALDNKAGDRKLICVDCHDIGESASDGKSSAVCKDARAPFPTHAKCTGCHATAFFTKPLTICTNCHIKASLNEESPMKEQTGDSAPLRTVFNHRLHLDPKQRVDKRFGYRKDCTFCHKFVRGGETVDLPAHAQCCECHTEERVEPNMNDCGGCHARPPHEKNPQSSVRKFSHVEHKTDPASGASLECTRCHSAVTRATKIVSLRLPAMATCVDCHQGETAFDYAECLKCHGSDIEKKPVPESHKKEIEASKNKKPPPK